MSKVFVKSEQLTRRQFVPPSQLAKLLQAAGVEHRAPEDVGGLLFGSLAHLFVGVATQFPEHWPTFRAVFIEAADDLRDVLTSDDPAATVGGIMARQQRDRALLGKSER